MWLLTPLLLLNDGLSYNNSSCKRSNNGRTLFRGSWCRSSSTSSNTASIWPTTEHTTIIYAKYSSEYGAFLLVDDDRISLPPKKCYSSCNLPQYKWLHFVDPTELRLGEVPLLYVNVTSWKLRNVFSQVIPFMTMGIRGIALTHVHAVVNLLVWWFLCWQQRSKT